MPAGIVVSSPALATPGKLRGSLVGTATPEEVSTNPMSIVPWLPIVNTFVVPEYRGKTVSDKVPSFSIKYNLYEAPVGRDRENVLGVPVAVFLAISVFNKSYATTTVPDTVPVIVALGAGADEPGELEDPPPPPPPQLNRNGTMMRNANN